MDDTEIKKFHPKFENCNFLIKDKIIASRQINNNAIQVILHH